MLREKSYPSRNHASWLDELLEDNREPFQCYGMSYRVRSVSQYRVFPTRSYENCSIASNHKFPSCKHCAFNIFTHLYFLTPLSTSSKLCAGLPSKKNASAKVQGESRWKDSSDSNSHYLWYKRDIYSLFFSLNKEKEKEDLFRPRPTVPGERSRRWKSSNATVRRTHAWLMNC